LSANHLQREVIGTKSRGADLHVHSTASDGALSPAELIAKAVDLHLDGLSLTDHDSVGGLPEFMSERVPGWFHRIPGIELTASYNGVRAHLLGYFVSDKKGAIATLLNGQERLNEQRVQEMLAVLKSMGIDLSKGSRQTITGLSISSMADRLVELGYAETTEDAEAKYLQKGGLAYVEKKYIGISEVIHAVLSDGAVPVLAHPLTMGLQDLRRALEDMSNDGLRGVEAYYDYSHHGIEGKAEHVEDIGRDLSLILTGGTDFHSDNTSPPLGSITVGADALKELSRARKKANISSI
jgi:predicted metal-dependent phosphoesterase TrpH